MKYFRKHADLIVIAKPPENKTGKKILRAITKKLGSTKKIRLITDIKTIPAELIYNHQVQTVCLLSHGEWFIAPIRFFLHMSGKRTVVIPTAHFIGKNRLKKIVGTELFPSPTLNLGIMGA